MTDKSLLYIGYDLKKQQKTIILYTFSLSYYFDQNKIFKMTKIGNSKKCCFWKIPFPKKVTHRKCESLPDPNVVALPTKYYIILLYFSKKEIGYVVCTYVVVKFLSYIFPEKNVKLTCLLLLLKCYVSFFKKKRYAQMAFWTIYNSYVIGRCKKKK